MAKTHLITHIYVYVLTARTPKLNTSCVSFNNIYNRTHIATRILLINCAYFIFVFLDTKFTAQQPQILGRWSARLDAHLVSNHHCFRMTIFLCDIRYFELLVVNVNLYYLIEAMSVWYFNYLQKNSSINKPFANV